jgi:choline/glycine/proline betaine transport protein
MFIARISRGRTVREFVVGVLIVPTTFSFIWMTVFGNTAIALDMGSAAGQIAAAVQADLSTALFKFLEQLPGSTITSVLAIALVAVFFVTSADSGSLVIDTIASGGAEETPRWQRVYWCSLEGLAAGLLLLAGGLSALQAATLVAALPFAVIMVLLAAGLYRGMRRDQLGDAAPASQAPLAQRLKTILRPPRRADIERQIEEVAAPALAAVRDGLRAEGFQAHLEQREDGAALAVEAEGERFSYRVEAASQPLPAYSNLDASAPRWPREWRLRARVGEPAAPAYDVTGFNRERLIDDILDKLGRWRARHGAVG